MAPSCSASIRISWSLDPALGDNAVLLEPTSVVAKAWDQIERIGRRCAHGSRRRALVTGAGPIGLLAALIGAQRGLDVHVLDHNESTGRSRSCARSARPTIRRPGRSRGFEPDIVLECTGAASVVLDVLGCTAPDGIVCLAGVSSGGPRLRFDIGPSTAKWCWTTTPCSARSTPTARITRPPSRRSQRADQNWLARLITRRVPLERWTHARAEAGRHQGRGRFS